MRRRDLPGLAALCGHLAIPLYGPLSPWWHDVKAGTWTEELAEHFRITHRDLKFASPEEGDQAFLETFAVPGHPLTCIESVHKPWTADPQATLAFAHEKGWLGGDSASHMRDLFGLAGLAIPPELAHAPDHLALELELLGLLAEQGDPESVDLFIAQHLDWVPNLAAAAASKGGVAPFYRALLPIVAETVA